MQRQTPVIELWQPLLPPLQQFCVTPWPPQTSPSGWQLPTRAQRESPEPSGWQLPEQQSELFVQ